MLRGLQLEMDYFTGVLNKQNLQAERALPAQRGELFFISLLMQTDRTKTQTKPNGRGTGGRGLLCLAQALLSAPLLWGALVPVAQVTSVTPAEDGRRGRAQRRHCESAVGSASVLCYSSIAVRFPHKVPELERISTLSSLRPTRPKWEILFPHRTANLDTEFCRCTDTRKEHCWTTITRWRRLTSRCAMKGKLHLKDMTFYLKRIKHSSTTQESTICC